MKKIICFFITITILSTTVLPVIVSGENSNETVSINADIATAYKGVIDDAIRKYGNYRMEQYAGIGVGLARLIDFDSNGTYELLIGCGQRVQGDEYFYEVYTYDDGLRKLTHTYCCDSMQLSYSMSLVERDNKVYIRTTSDGVCDGSVYYSTLSNGKWVTTEYYWHDGSWCDCDSQWSGKDVYMINGNPATKEEAAPEVLMSKYHNYDADPYAAEVTYGQYGVKSVLDYINTLSSMNTDGIDYVSLFGELINGRKDYNTNLEDLLMSEYATCNTAFFKDCYMVDMNNDSVPELLCIFCDEWGPDEYAVLIEYENGFKLGREIPFNYNSGSAGSEYYRILKANGKFYYEKYFSARQNYDDPNGWISRNEIVMNENGEEKIVYSATSNYGTNIVNGQQVDEIDYEYVHKNFEIVVDGRNYGETWSGYEPQFGKDYTKFWDDNVVITVTIDGKTMNFDQQPVAVNNRVMVPMRAIFEELGATVEWDGATQTVTSTKGDTVIVMTLGKNIMYKNGAAISLDVAPMAQNSRTLVPVRAVAEALDCSVEWYGDNQTVVITSYIMNFAKSLYDINESKGGNEHFKSLVQTNSLMLSTLSEICKAQHINNVVLGTEKICCEVAMAIIKAKLGAYSTSAKELTETALSLGTGVALESLARDIPDIETFIYNLGMQACNRQVNDLSEMIILHAKIKAGSCTKDDAVRYVCLHYQSMINLEYANLSVTLLANMFPGWLESFVASVGTAAEVVLSEFISDTLGSDLNIAQEHYFEVVKAYVEFGNGKSIEFYNTMKKLFDIPAVYKWATNVESYYNDMQNKIK